MKLPRFWNRSPRPPILPQPFDGNYAPIIEYLSTLIKREMKSKKLTGLSVALIDNQRMVWSEGFGFANKELNIAASSETKYRAGSASKVFNAAAIMREVELRNLDLDKPVVEYVPDFRINSRFGSTDDITLRNLLTHHSGLPRDYLAGMWSRQLSPLGSILELLSTAHTANPANKICAYSNIGVSLSGLALQIQSGRNYEDYISEFLLQPLQMVNSDFSGHLTGSDAALGYSDRKVVEELPLRDLPAGGLNTTVNDMANFALMMLGKGRFGVKEILSPESIAEMLRVQNTKIPLDLTTRTGLAWAYEFDKLGGMFDVVNHTGGTASHATKLSLVPELGFGVVVMCNNKTNAKEQIVNAALGQLLLTRDVKDNVEHSVIARPEVDASEIIAGDYAGCQGLHRVYVKKNKLYANTTHDNKTYRLTSTGDNWYLPEYKVPFIPVSVGDNTIKVTRSTLDGRDLLLINNDGSMDIVGERIERQSESALWNKRVGYYKNCNQDGPVQFRIDGASLQFGDGYYLIEFFHQSMGNHQRAVRPISDFELVELGIGEGLGNTITYSESSGKPTLIALGVTFEFDVSESSKVGSHL